MAKVLQCDSGILVEKYSLEWRWGVRMKGPERRLEAHQGGPWRALEPTKEFLFY